MNARQSAPSRKSLVSFGACALMAMGAAAAQVAASDTTGIDASGNYQHEVLSCRSGETQQDRPTCLREARNAQAEKKRGALDTVGDLEANALARCNVFTGGEDKAACRARVMGMGNVSGSVAGGGMLREVETVVVPEDATSVTLEPKTAGPIVLLQGDQVQVVEPDSKLK